MKDDEGTLTRREFVRGVAVGAAGAAAGLGMLGCRSAQAGKSAAEGGSSSAAGPAAGGPAGGTAQHAATAAAPDAGSSGTAAAAPRARVVLVRDEGAVDAAGNLVDEVVGRMVDQAVCGVTEADDPAAAWRGLVGPADVAGIKTNEWESLPTPPAVEARLRQRILEAGVPESALFMADRGALSVLGGCTALVNARPARSHHWAGMGGCIKNYIQFAETPSVYHPDSCADLAAVWKLPVVAGKTRINLLVVLTPLFYGRGPHHFDRRYVWSYKGILASRDPVAVDAVGAELLRKKRLAFFGEDRPLVPTKHIGLAETRHGLGVADLSRIDLTKIGWTTDSLV